MISFKFWTSCEKVPIVCRFVTLFINSLFLRCSMQLHCLSLNAICNKKDTKMSRCTAMCACLCEKFTENGVCNWFSQTKVVKRGYALCMHHNTLKLNEGADKTMEIVLCSRFTLCIMKIIYFTFKNPPTTEFILCSNCCQHIIYIYTYIAT